MKFEMNSARLGFHHLPLISSDHRSSGRDAEEGAGAGGSPEEAGSDPTAAIQVPAQRTEGGRGLTEGPKCALIYSKDPLMADRLLYSDMIIENTALETGLFGEKNKCLCSVVYPCGCV